MGHELFGQRVDARQVQVGLAIQQRELAEIPAGKIGSDIARVAFDDVFVVEDPFRGCGRRLFQAVRVGKIQTNLMENLRRFPDPAEKLLIADRFCQQPMILGEFPAKQLQLSFRKQNGRPQVRDRRGLAGGEQQEDRGLGLPAFPDDDLRIAERS